MIERALIDVTGLVQGVGFRPFVHSLATSLDLRGFVQNRGSHLFVDIEGEPGALAAFVERLSTTAPPLAAIDRVDCQRTTAAAHQHFMIAGSQAAAESLVRVPPDVATCEDCRRELFDPSNRRYRHPFITCTTCGPRFTIVRQLPYDREIRRWRLSPCAPRAGPNTPTRVIDGSMLKRLPVRSVGQYSSRATPLVSARAVRRRFAWRSERCSRAASWP